ncbi:hypothetical protein ACHAXT_007352 [Thalassiosira profunda]
MAKGSPKKALGGGGYMPPSLFGAPASPTTAAAAAEAGVTSPPAPPPPVEEPTPMRADAPVGADAAAAEGEADGAAAPRAATPTGSSEGGGLFAGLHMSSSPGGTPTADDAAPPAPTANSNTNEEDDDAEMATLAKNKEDKDVLEGSDRPTSRAATPVHSNKPPSRASTPVHSNATPGAPGAAGSTPTFVRKGSSGSHGTPTTPTTPRGGVRSGTPPARRVPFFGAPFAAGPLVFAAESNAKVAHPDQALRLLRKFYRKTSPFIPKHAGGAQAATWYGWVFGSSAETAGNADGNLECYRELSVALEVDREGELEAEDTSVSDEGGGEGDVIVESILGHRGDSPAKARRCLASFVQLMAAWCRSSAEAAKMVQEVEAAGKTLKGESVMGAVTPDLIAMGIDCASALVAHGCLDELYLKLGEAEDEHHTRVKDEGESKKEREEEVGAPSLIKRAINVLVESVCAADLSGEKIELAALKFLLTTGCRMVDATGGSVGGVVEGAAETAPAPGAEPMVRGTHLLQTIRVCSQVYLHAEGESNKTTAKAALQQLVITVFVQLQRSIERERLEAKIGEGGAVSGDAEAKAHTREVSTGSVAAGAGVTFPTQDHRDAYLVLRSLCKLSMQTTVARPPPTATAPSSGGGAEGDEHAAPSVGAPPAPAPHDDHFDPALDSRILALQLLLHILRHPSAPSVLDAGPQFHYAVRQYLCTSLLKNTTSPDTATVELSLRLFVPLIRNFRALLKTEIEAFVTNVFFVILDSKNSTVQHKLLVVTLFEEICSDATTLAEIFLNYDCDLSAVDLFSRIVNTLSKVARIGLTDSTGTGSGGAASSSLQFVAGAGAVRAETTRLDHRELRLAAMKALRQVLASLHSSIVTPINGDKGSLGDISVDEASLQIESLRVDGHRDEKKADEKALDAEEMANGAAKKTLVEMYDSKKKRREEESQAALKFNQKPTTGLAYAAECGHVDASDPVDVARYLLQNKDIFDKAQIGEYLGREKEWKDGFALKVLRAYGDALDFAGMPFDDAIRYYLSGFRLPGEAQKIDRIMEVFAARYTDQNAGVFPTADSAFILAFSIIMLNTDLHNPAIKEDRKMTPESFKRMNSGVCDGGDFPDEMLTAIFNRIKNDQISLKEDDDARESAGVGKDASTAGLGDFFFGTHYVEEDKTREMNFQKEGDQIVRDTESMLKRRRKASKPKQSKKSHLRDSLKKQSSAKKFVGTADSGLRDEYVTPMFDVAWGPALAVFSTAIESANGTDGMLASIATDEEMDHAVDNAALAIEVSLNAFQLAICIAGLCGNDTARDAYVRALYNFTLLGSGHLLADRHIQCVQSLLRLGRDDGELLGVTWEHIFRALTEIYRLHQVWEGMARNERREVKAREKAARMAEKAMDDGSSNDANDDESTTSSELSDYNDVRLEDEMDKRMIDEANAVFVHGAVPPDIADSIFQRSIGLSRRSLKDFVYQLCRVSRMEISGYGGHVGSDANDIDLTNDHYMKHHTLTPSDSNHGFGGGVSASQPAIYSLEKLVEVTHFNMESRPRLIFADIWGTISAHLASTALHEEPAVAMFAVDSLRQLALQFLNREELGVFEFQRRFLKSLETIMSRSTHVSVKELLLSSVEQLISIYGFSAKGEESGSQHHRGTLRSGWRSVLLVLGTAGLDKNDAIALQGFKLLTEQIEQCMSVCDGLKGADDGNHPPDSLLSEYFVDLVNTLLLYISGPRKDLSSKSIDSLVRLSDVLAEGKVPLKSTRRKAPPSPAALPGGTSVESTVGRSDELELWWPMLLGLSQTMGDRRAEVRLKGLGTLLNIINKHFFQPGQAAPADGDDSSPQHGDLQTLQLIFRGILVPALEFEEIDGNSTSGFAPELLPPKFVHFITMPPSPEAVGAGGQHEWISTTFEHLIDGCISICLRSLDAFGSDALIEEVLAMLNSCLLSDSGHLAVKGLRRLKQFVSKDLELKDITDDTWATVSHMLFRVMSIRGLPPSTVPETEGATEEQKEQLKQEHAETMNEFIREQRFFSNRRYIGCNATMVIGSLLTDKSMVESMGVHWYLFLTSGLGKGIRDWERAANILDSNSAQEVSDASPPHYLENVFYARRWMTKFLLSILTQQDVSTLESAPCQKVLKEETESLLRAFLAKESSESSSAIEMKNVSKMVSDVLDCFNGLNEDKLSAMKWLSPVLSACIQTNNTTIRTSVQILLTRQLKGGNQSTNGSGLDNSN